MSRGDDIRGAGWRRAEAPSLDDIAALAEDAFARLPEEFRRLCAGVTFFVEELADDETLADLEIEDPFDLLGLYHGVDLAQDGALQMQPNRIVLYRRALLDYWAAYEETLGDLVSHVVVHEIGHHLGLSDAEMEAIEAAADRS